MHSRSVLYSAYSFLTLIPSSVDFRRPKIVRKLCRCRFYDTSVRQREVVRQCGQMRRLSGTRNEKVFAVREGESRPFPHVYSCLRMQSTFLPCLIVSSVACCTYHISSSRESRGQAEICRGRNTGPAIPVGENRENDFVITPFVPTLVSTVLLGSGRRAFCLDIECRQISGAKNNPLRSSRRPPCRQRARARPLPLPRGAAARAPF